MTAAPMTAGAAILGHLPSRPNTSPQAECRDDQDKGEQVADELLVVGMSPLIEDHPHHYRQADAHQPRECRHRETQPPHARWSRAATGRPASLLSTLFCSGSTRSRRRRPQTRLCAPRSETQLRVRVPTPNDRAIWARRSEPAVATHHARGLRVVSDQVAAPLALAHVQAFTAEPVPLVETDHAHEASSLHEGQCPPRWLAMSMPPRDSSLLGTVRSLPSTGWRRFDASLIIGRARPAESAALDPACS